MALDRLRGDSGNRRIILLDSNAIMMLFEFSINLEQQLTSLFGRYILVVPLAVKEELHFLKENGKGAKKNKAKASLDIIEKKGFEVIETKSKGNVDDIIYELAKKLDATVLTNDKELRKRLRSIPVNVVFLRGKQKLQVE